jgi:hypothetical protein
MSKTSELIDEKLDYWVGVIEEKDVYILGEYCYVRTYTNKYVTIPGFYSPSTDWSQGGPIIERERIELSGVGPFWAASMTPGNGLEFHQLGDTYLQAAMRCFVASKYGDEVPDES